MAGGQDDRAGSALTSSRADQITLDEIVVRKGGLPPPSGPPLVVIGWRVFVVLVIFIGVSYLVMAGFAWWTYPSLEDFAVAEPAGIVVQGPSTPEAVGTVAEPEAVARWQAARAEWLAQIKELGQLFIVTPLLPLLGAVLGYIFGREQRALSEE